MRQIFLLISVIFLQLVGLAAAPNIPFVQKQALDSVRNVIKENRNDTIVGRAYLNLAKLYDKNYPDSAEQIYLLAISTIEAAINNIPFLSDRNISLKKRDIKALQELLADAYIAVGTFNSNRAKILKSLDYYYKSLSISEQVKDTAGIVEALYNIAYVHYYYLEDYPYALNTYLKSLQFTRETEDKEAEATLLRNIAEIYEIQGHTALALDFSLKSLRIRENLGDKQAISNTLNSLAEIYRKKGDLRRAFEYGERGLLIRREIGDNRGIAFSLVVVGETYLRQKNLIKAKDLGEQSLRIGKQRSNPDIIQKAAFLLQEIYNQQGKWKEAFEMNKLYNQMSDSIGIKKNGILAIRQDVSYEFEKRAISDSLNFIVAQQQKDYKIEQQQVMLTREKIIRNSMIVVSILSLLITIVVFNSLNIKHKATQIAKANEIRQKISRDMHDEIGSRLTSISMLCDLGITEGNVYGNELYKKISAQSLEVSEQLSEVVWATDPQNDNLPSLVSHIRDYVSKFLDAEIMGTTMTYVLHLPDEVPELNLKPDMSRNLFYILKESLNNCVKHSGASVVEVFFQIDEDKNYKLRIIDNGRGVSSDAIPLNRSGLRNMRKRAEEINGKFDIISDVVKGLQIEISGNLV